MKGRLPVAMAIPLRRPGDAARVVLIGPPGPLRSAIAEQLRARTTLLACLDLPGHLEHVPSRDLSHARLTDAAVVFLTVPRPPRLASRLWRKYSGAAPNGAPGRHHRRISRTTSPAPGNSQA